MTSRFPTMSGFAFAQPNLRPPISLAVPPSLGGERDHMFGTHPQPYLFSDRVIAVTGKQ